MSKPKIKFKSLSRASRLRTHWLNVQVNLFDRRPHPLTPEREAKIRRILAKIETKIAQFPRYFEQIISGSVIRLDDAESHGWYLSHFGNPQEPPDQSEILDLNYVTVAFKSNWREITEAEAKALLQKQIKEPYERNCNTKRKTNTNQRTGSPTHVGWQQGV